MTGISTEFPYKRERDSLLRCRFSQLRRGRPKSLADRRYCGRNRLVKSFPRVGAELPNQWSWSTTSMEPSSCAHRMGLPDLSFGKATVPATGTVMVRDINPGAAGSIRRLFYSQRDPLSQPRNRPQAMNSGRATALEGTVLVRKRDVQPGAEVNAVLLVAVKGKLFFLANDGVVGASCVGKRRFTEARSWSGTSIRPHPNPCLLVLTDLRN